MVSVNSLLAELISSQWKDPTSTALEIRYFTLHEGSISTSTIIHKDHFERLGDSSDDTWQVRSCLPHYFDPQILVNGLQQIVDGKAQDCVVPLIRACGFTDGGYVSTDCHDESFQVARLESGEFEIRLLFGKTVGVDEIYRKD